ncbi:MAG TPA: hypothetical protein PKZ36_00935 [Candidatus Paceibacterota bacterium]|nr:hypothetical protein [Candidatus Paceibacterota bacterium]HPT17959.1 hypothetical protein [Candidatus Paceibacterota bacterium]
MENDKGYQQKEITKELFQRIEKEGLKQKSKTYFKLRIVFLVLIIIAIFIISIFLCSFVLFSLRASDQISLIGLGGHGTVLFFKLFPWGLFLLNSALIIWAGLMIRSFRFGYKTPILYLGLGTVFVMTICGVIIDQGTSLQYNIWHDTHDNPIFIGSIYEKVRTRPDLDEKIFRGIILDIQQNSLLVAIEPKIEEDEILNYRVVLENIKPKTFQIGDSIYIEGIIINNEIKARAIVKSFPHPYFPKE